MSKHWAFFDHAAVAPLSGPAQRALGEWATDMAENGVVHERRWVNRVEEVRQLVGQLIGVDPLDVAFIKNTSEGVGIVAEGFPWKDGDNVVTAAEEYPANIYPWMNLAGRGVVLRRVESRGNRLEMDDILAAIDARTRILSLSMVEFASGFRNDLDALGSWCRKRGIYVFVDAIQGLGVIPLDAREAPIDFLAADGHKWLLGPEGAGILYVRRDLVDLLHPVGVGWNSVIRSRDFSRIDFTLKPHAGRWESGSLNVGGVHALGASLELLLGIGTASIWKRIQELTDYLCEQTIRAGFEVFSSRRAEDKSGIVSLTGEGIDPRAASIACRTEKIVINHRAGRIRVSPHCYNTVDEIDRLIDVLARFAKSPPTVA